MEEQVIQPPTKNCPGIVYFKGRNCLEITGRSIAENPENIFTPLNDWITSHFLNKHSLIVHIKLDYINSGSSKCLFDILKKLTGYHRSGNDVVMKWFFEEDDESMFDLGEHFRDSAGIPLRLERIN
jgi:hypothetical protein